MAARRTTRIDCGRMLGFVLPSRRVRVGRGTSAVDRDVDIPVDERVSPRIGARRVTAAA